MQERIRPTAEIFIAVIAEHMDLLVDCRPDGFAIGLRWYRDKTSTALAALYSRGYE